MAKKTRHLEDALEEARQELEGTPSSTTEETTPTSAGDDPGISQETAQEDVSEPDPSTTREEPEEAPEPPREEKEEPSGIDESLENANSIIRRRLEKQAAKFNSQLAEKDDIIKQMRAEFEEFKKSIPQAPKKELTREQFTNDIDFVKALTQSQIDADREAQLALQKEKDEKDAALRAEQQRADDDIRQRQERFQRNVANCFGADEERNQFMKKVAKYTTRGLSDLLDACPVASDYLLGSPKGPRVLDRLLSDVEAFNRVFDPQGITPMDQYYELKQLEKEIYGKVTPELPPEPAPAPEPEPAPAKKPLPRYGKPGAQGGGRSADVFTDPKVRRDEVRRLMGF